MALGVYRPVLERVKRAGARLDEDAGQTLTEYSLILAFVALVCIAALTIIGGAVNDFLTDMASQV
jgi:pilus assembly protein Flp/PilA